MFEKVQVPSREMLKLLRCYSESSLDPEQDDWDGWLGKDERGIFTYARRIYPYDLKVYKGEKIYIENYYTMLEDKIIELYQEAVKIHRRMKKRHGLSCITSVLELIYLDAALLVLHIYHHNPPDKKSFLAPDQLEEVLEYEVTMEHYIEYLNAMDEEMRHTPLYIGNWLKDIFDKKHKIQIPILNLRMCNVKVNNALN